MKLPGKLFMVLAMVLCVGAFVPGSLIAAEHGGTEMKEHGGADHDHAKEHGGAEVAPEATQEHGGAAMAEGSHMEESDSAVIQEAADALRDTNPDLAGKLDNIVAAHATK